MKTINFRVVKETVMEEEFPLDASMKEIKEVLLQKASYVLMVPVEKLQYVKTATGIQIKYVKDLTD